MLSEKFLEEQNTKIISQEKLIKEKKILFEDGIIFENEIANAYIDTSSFDIVENFGLEQIPDDSSEYYNAYLNVNMKTDEYEIEIIKVSDNNREYYIYIPKEEEKEILRKSLEEYVKSIEGRELKDLYEEVEELEQE